MNNQTRSKVKSVIHGIIAFLVLIGFYLALLSFFQGRLFALLSFRDAWYWILPLAGGFGIQAGIFSWMRSISNVQFAASGGVSAGSMVACCSHYAFSFIPLLGASGIATALMAYQKWFFMIGITANIIGIGMMLAHYKKMKGGCHG